MNTLDWVVNELISTLEDYISKNKPYFDYLQEQTIDKPAATGAATDAEAASQVVASQTALFTTAAPALNKVQSADELGYVNRAKLTVEGIFFTKVSLKSEKYSEAKLFVSQVKAIISKEMKYDKEDIRKKIGALSKVLDDEVVKMTEILRDHKQPQGTYDALLRIFADTLTWLKREENLDVLAVAIKYESLGETHKNFREPVKIGSTSYFVPLPLTQSLVTYLTRQMLGLHLDQARFIEHERIPYERLLPEVQAENIIDVCRFHVLFIDQHTNQNNTRDSFAIRQNNNKVVLDCLRMECTDIYSTMHGFLFATKNAFMDNMLNQLKVWSTQADEKIRERVKAAIDARQERTSGTAASASVANLNI